MKQGHTEAPSHTEEQSAAINSTASRIAVNAGAGTGKTRVIVGRIRALLDSGVAPENIVALSFTNAGAREIRRRFPFVSARTVHSYVYGAIPFAPASDEETEAAAKAVGLPSLEEESDLSFLMLRKLGAARNLLKQKGKIDFRGALELYIEMFHARIKEPSGTAFLIDEAQDSSDLEWEIFNLWGADPWGSEDSYSLFIVGDVNQSIYGFRGAHREGFLEFARGATVFDLTRNFRSRDEVLALSNRLASTPLTGRGPGGSAEVASFDSEAAEGEWIIAQADALSRLGSVAILTRSNAHAAQIAAFLPYAEVQRAKPAARLHACKRLIASGEKSSRVIARACPFPDYRPSLLALLEETKVEDWLIAFDEWVELRDPSPRRIYVGTVHSVKGQEFDSVVIPGVDTYGDEPEEARVLYVAMTRAREHLRVSASSVRGGARRSAPHLSRIR